MTSQELAHITELANQVGKPARVVCRYEWGRVSQEFQWNFYRRGRWIGSTTDPKQVVKKISAYVATVERNAA